MPSPVTKLIKSADQQRTEETIIKLTNNLINDVPHPEAVTATNNIIINVLTKIERTNFSADAIEMAIENAGAKNYAKENDPSTAEANAHKNGCLVLEKYDEHFHGGAYGKKADQDLSTKYKRDPNKWGCLPGALRGNIPTQTKENASKLENIGLPNESPEEYKQNNWSQEINKLMNCLNINKALLIKMKGIEKVPPKDWKILQNTSEGTIATHKDTYSQNEVDFFIQELEKTIKA